MSAAPSNLRLIREASPDCVVVAFWGRMDAEAVRQAAEGLDKAVEGTQPVVVDLTSVDAIDSLGVALLVRLAKTLRDQGRELAVIPGDGRVARVLGLARVDRILNVALTRDAARRSLGL
ncbi:STAS domain-containing protein [Acidobacteria bacterium ACD]|nr:STAS domain-containing protein [Acidobacteria bacterium ACD]